VHPKPLDRMLAVAKESCEKFGIFAYDEQTGKGLLRFINARINQAADQILVTLVLNCSSERVPQRVIDAAGDIASAMPEIVGVCANFNSKRGNRILGDETVCLTGKAYIEEQLKSARVEAAAELQRGVRFQLSSESFFQINSAQAVKLFDQLSERVDEFRRKPENCKTEITLIDAYAGVGAIALWLAPQCKNVIAIEENAAAVKDGQLNVDINGVKNVEFHLGLVEEVLPHLLAQSTKAHIVVLDPPRKGCSPAVLEAVLKLAPEMIIYVSCNPVTLARDLKILHAARTPEQAAGNGNSEASDTSQGVFGYKTEQVLPIDLFPQTYHVESIAVLYRHLGDGQTNNVEETRQREGTPSG
jgi:23S rRNA (uracil1939-C5)-methyltransferase